MVKMYSTVTFYNSQHIQTVPEMANPVDQLQWTALVPSRHNCSSPVTTVVTPHAASQCQASLGPSLHAPFYSNTPQGL